MTLPVVFTRALLWISITFFLVSVIPTEAAVGNNCTTENTCGSYNGWTCEGGVCVCNTSGYTGDQCVPKTPTITMPQSTYTANVGSNVTIICLVTDTAEVDFVVWIHYSSEATKTINVGSDRYNGGTLSTPSLTILSVQEADAGAYWCRARNAASLWGSSATNTTLTVTSRPSVEITGPSQSGTTLNITCTASVKSASPAITAIQWKKDGTILTIPGTNNKYSGGDVTTPSLTINNVGNTDKGDYQCVATNAVGSTTSDTVTLAIPKVTISGSSTVVYGSDITFTGTVTSSPAAQLVEWQKVSGGQTTDIDISDQKYSGSSVAVGSPKLVINNAVSPDDEATYQLVVTNLVGKKTSTGINLDVTGSIPMISITPSAPVISLVYGMSATLNALVTRTLDSPPVLSGSGAWQKQINGGFTNINLSETKYDGSTNNVTKPSLVINNAAYTDEGAYRFTARNLVGSAFSVAKTLNVTGTPINLSRVKRQADNTTAAPQSSDSSSINTANITTTTTIATTTVSKPAVSIRADPAISVQFGSTLRITATVNANPGATSAVWQRKSPSTGQWTDININDSKYDGSSDTPNTPVLVISSITYDEDQTNFRCVVRNAEGNTTSNELSIDVTGTVPTVSVTPTGPIQVTYNTTLMTPLLANIIAGANTQGAQEVRWRKTPVNGIVTTIDINNSKYTGSSTDLTNPRLVINNAVFGDEADYQCQARNSEGWGSSNKVNIDVIGGNLTVTSSSDETAKIGESITLECTVNGPEVSSVKWKKGGSDVSVDGNKYTGSTVDTPSLTINNLEMLNAGQYQCTATNPGGTYHSATMATLTVTFRQFQDYCNGSLHCDINKDLKCSPSTSLCVCIDTHYHKEKTCYLRERLEVNITSHTSSTSVFMVSWSQPSESNLQISYIVKWRVHNEPQSSQQSNKIKQQTYSVTSGLIPGQLYIITVSTVVDLVDPTSTIEKDSDPKYIRMVPLPPGSIIVNQSNLAANNLQLTWNRPESNTFVSKYSVIINGVTENTEDSNPDIHFSGQLTPGEHYDISIVTISGENSNNDEQKMSSPHVERIRTTPTRPGPPTGVTCPTEPKGQSLLISWSAPTDPNGQIQKYIINVYYNGDLIKTADTEINVVEYNVDGLSEEKKYIFKVQTVNDAINSTSVESEKRICETKAGLSTEPTHLSNETPSSRGVQISFSTPNDVKGVLAGYRIIIIDDLNNCQQEIQITCPSCRDFGFSERNCKKNITSPVTEINGTQIYNVSNLDPYTTYTVKVAAVNGEGEGTFAGKKVRTDEEVPQKPSVSKTTIKSATEIDLGWTLASPSPGNVTYTVSVLEAEDNTSDIFTEKMELQYYGFSKKEEVISGLEEFWRYKFTVKAATIKGSQTSEESDIIRTNQGAPGKVRSLTVERKSDTYKAAVVRWKVPSLKDQNGILVNYKFVNNGSETLLPVSFDENVFEEKEISVVPEMVYIIEVYAINSENTEGEKENNTYFAHPGPPPKPTDAELVLTQPGQHQPTQTTIQIDINTEFFTKNDNGEPVYFGIAVCSDCNNVKANPDISYFENLPNWYKARGQGFPLYRVTNESYVQEVKTASSGRRKRSTEVPYVIGKDNTCESQGTDAYCNGPLSPGKTYKVVVFSCTNGGCVQTDDIGPFATAAVPESEFPVGAVVGGVVAAVVVVFVIIVAGFVVKRRRLGKTTKHTELENVVDIEDSVPKNIPRKRPIRLRDLADKVAEKHKDSNLYFAREYEDLKALSAKHATETSETDSNKLKNRYVNILPFDVTRVKLQLTEDDDPSTDFINANYLPGYKSEREYIATQGPIPGTIDDFWRMIWEQNVSIIVMLTLCKEEGRVKCEMYWPENVKEPKQYGDLVVETVSCSTVNFYDFRIFKIKLGDTTRTLKHFHFLQWKDFSANVQNDVMIDFIKNVRNHIRPPDMNGPVVVHCSAGVGRTGTYCALDHLFQVIDDHDLDHSIDIFDLVLNLREHRMFMVQTEQQYVFIHDCVRDYVERKRKEMQGDLLYENVNRAFVADDPIEESMYQNYSNQRTDL